MTTFPKLSLTRRNLRRLAALCLASLLIFSIGAYAGRKLTQAYVVEQALDVYLDWRRNRAAAQTGDLAWEPQWSALHQLERGEIALPEPEGRAGALLDTGDGILHVDGHGKFRFISRDYKIALIDLPRVPMNLAALKAAPIADQENFNIELVRTTDIILAPNESTREYWLLAAHHEYNASGDCLDIKLSRIPVSLSKETGVVATGDWTTLHQVKPCVTFLGAEEVAAFKGDHTGGRLALTPDGALLLTVGDHGYYGLDGRPKAAMDPNSGLGKILKIDLATGAAQIYASGLRNPAGLAFDRDGRLWTVDNGPQGGDELNIVTAGANFGFPEVTYGVNYGDRPWPFNPAQGRHGADYQKPAFAWINAISPTDIVRAPGQMFPRWEGDLIVGSLRAKSLNRVRLEGDRVVYVEQIDMGARVRDVIVTADDTLAVLTDLHRVSFVRRSPDEASRERLASPSTAAPLPHVKGLEAGRAAFIANCASCHRLDEYHDAGPSLAGVVGRDVGTLHGYAYSAALYGRSARWSEDRLKRFMRNTALDYPGSRMAGVALSDSDAAAIVKYLARAPDAIEGQAAPVRMSNQSQAHSPK